MAKQTSRHFGGKTNKAAPVGRGSAAAHGGGEIGRAAAIPPARSAVKKRGTAAGKAVPKAITKVSAKRNA